MDHRKTPSRNVFVPPSWLVVLTALACVVAVAGIGWLIVDGTGTGNSDKPAAVAPTHTATSATPTPTKTSATPTPKPTPTPTPKPKPTVSRTGIAVSVLNNTGTTGAAGAFSIKVKDAGWTVGGVGNWRGSVQGNTVYYPVGHEAEAQQLGEDVGISRILPRVDPMRTDRLTIILAGPQ
ncbi:MAG: hypothetical protein JWR83_1554 [Aeromicrobium sp.]|nr:hypothetical protein [Aeromicrobium sp.]